MQRATGGANEMKNLRVVATTRQRKGEGGRSKRRLTTLTAPPRRSCTGPPSLVRALLSPPLKKILKALEMIQILAFD